MARGAVTGIDAALLAMEGPSTPQHIGNLSVFGPGPDGPLTYDVVLDLVGARLGAMPSAQRVVIEAPFGLARPSWAPATGFDPEFHVRHTAIPAGGGLAALARLVAELHARGLDRARPLWELWVVDGVADGRVAIYTKVHMAAVDAVSGVEPLTALLDSGSRPVPANQPHNGTADGGRARVDRVLGIVPDQPRRAAGFPWRLARRTARAAGEQFPGLRDTLLETVRRTPGLEPVARLLPAAEPDDDLFIERPTGRAPRVSFNAPITARRRVAFADLAFADILHTKRAAGTTVTDVVVAVCAGALRTWLDQRDELPTSPLVAMVPVMVAGPGGTRAGAHVSGLVVPLPTHVADPVDRLRRTSEALRFAKDRHHALPASVIQDMASFAPPAVAALAGRLVGALPYRTLASPTINLAITNVPGPRHELALAGRPLDGTYPLLAINATSPLHIGLQSTPGAVHVGAVACRDHLPDLAALINLLPGELSRLAAASRLRP